MSIASVAVSRRECIVSEVTPPIHFPANYLRLSVSEPWPFEGRRRSFQKKRRRRRARVLEKNLYILCRPLCFVEAMPRPGYSPTLVSPLLQLRAKLWSVYHDRRDVWPPSLPQIRDTDAKSEVG